MSRDDPQPHDLSDVGLDAALEALFARRATDDEQSHAPPPAELGDYRIEREIGRGGMGVVYLAEQLSLRRRVALKVLPAHLTLREDAITRFQVEASSAARLKHPGIVQVHAVGESSGHHFFAMEYVEGIPLQDVLGEMRATGIDNLTAAALRQPGNASYVAAACLIAARLADALQHAHDAGVIHRDVKPSNILLRPDGSPVLTDFGLAREEGLPHLTQTGVFAGTPHYASPEQAAAKKGTVDHRSDVFSLGVTLYELLTLRRPFDGETSHEVLDKITRREVQNPRRLNRRLPTDLATIVLKALEKDPRNRYQSAAALAGDLRAFLAFQPIAARPASMRTVVAKFARRHRTGALTACVAVTVALAAVTMWFARPVYLALESYPSGAEVRSAKTGELVGTTPLEVELTPGVHAFSLENPARRLFSYDVQSGTPWIEFDLKRGRRERSVTLLSADEILRRMAAGQIRDPEIWWSLLPATNVDAARDQAWDLMAAYATTGRLNEARRARDELARLGGQVEDAGELLRRAEELTNRVRQAAGRTPTLLHDGQLALAHEAIQKIPSTLGSYSFTPGQELHEELMRQLVEATLRRAKSVQAGNAADASRTLALLAAIAPDHDEHARLAELVRLQRRSAALLEAEGRIAAAESQHQLVHALGAIESFRGEDADALRARAEAKSTELARREEVRTQRGYALEAFGQGSAEGLRLVVTDETLQRELQSAQEFLLIQRAALDEIKKDEPENIERAREHATQLDANTLPPDFRPAATQLIERLRASLEAAANRESIRHLCAEIRQLCEESQLEAAQTRGAELPSEPPAELRVIVATTRARLAALTAEHEQRTQTRVLFERYLGQVRDSKLAEARQSHDLLTSRWRAAIRELDQRIAEHPTCERLVERAELHLLLGNYGDALADARAARAERETPATARLCGKARYGVFLERGERSGHHLRDALADFEAADQLSNGQDGNSAWWRGICLEQLKRKRDAIQAYRHAQALAEPSADLALRLAISICPVQPGVERPAQATEAIGLAWDALHVPFCADDLLAAFGGCRGALRAGAVRQFRIDAYWIRAVSNGHLGRFAQMEADCREMLALDDAFADGHLRLGIALAGQQNTEAARRECDRAVELAVDQAKRAASLERRDLLQNVAKRARQLKDQLDS